MPPQQIMVLPTLLKTCKYFVCRCKDGITFPASYRHFLWELRGMNLVLPSVLAKGMWFCLIRDYEWVHGKPPIFNYRSPWLPGLSLAGWGSMLQGPSHSAMLPEVTRASWFSDSVWVCVCVFVFVPSPIFFLPHQDPCQWMACYRPA